MYKSYKFFLLALFITGSIISYTQSSNDVDNLLSLDNLPDSLDINNYIIKVLNKDHKIVLLENGWGSLVLPIKDNKISIGRKVISKSGVYVISALDENNNVILRKQIFVKSNGINNFLESYLSYPNLKAGSNDKAQIVSLLLDKEGNLCDDDFETKIQFLSDNTLPIIDHFTRSDVSQFQFASRDKTQDVLFSVASASSFSKPFKVVIESNTPAQCNLEYSRNSDKADGQQTIKILINNVTDKYGNPVVNGTSLQLVLLHDGLINSLYASTLNARSVIDFTAPSQPCTFEIYAVENAQVISNKLLIPFVSSQLNFNMQYADGIMRFSDIYTQSGHILEDGTYASLLLTGNNKKYRINSQSEKGEIIFDLNENNIPDGYYLYELLVLGEEYKGEINR